MSYHNNPRIVTDGLVLCLDANAERSIPKNELPVKGANLKVWLDAADESSFSYGSGAAVSEWKDKSGNNNHVSQATAASQPLRNSTYNSKPVLVFDGTDDSLSSTNSIDLSTSHTIFVVARQSVASNDAGLISINSSLSNGITLHNGAAAYFYFGSGGYAVLPAITTSETNILTKVWDGSTSGTRTAYKNGTVSTTSGTMSSANSTGVLRLGQQSSYLNGVIAEVIIYDTELTATQIKKVHTYLSNKWGITTSDPIVCDMTPNSYDYTLGANVVYSNNSFTLSSAGAGGGGALNTSAITTSTTCTLVFWIKTTEVQALFWGATPSAYSGAYYVGAYHSSSKEYYGNCGSPDYYQDLEQKANIYDYIRDNNWHMVEFKNVDFSSWTNQHNFNSYNTFEFGNGECAKIMIYNKNLSSAESLQNYNAMKTRFGL